MRLLVLATVSACVLPMATGCSGTEEAAGRGSEIDRYTGYWRTDYRTAEESSFTGLVIHPDGQAVYNGNDNEADGSRIIVEGENAFWGENADDGCPLRLSEDGQQIRFNCHDLAGVSLTRVEMHPYFGEWDAAEEPDGSPIGTFTFDWRIWEGSPAEDGKNVIALGSSFFFWDPELDGDQWSGDIIRRGNRLGSMQLEMEDDSSAVLRVEGPQSAVYFLTRVSGFEEI